MEPHSALSRLIARAAYETLRMMHQLSTRMFMPPWADAPFFHRTELLENADWYIENPEGSAEEAHTAWVHRLRERGWTYAEKFNPSTRTHPSLRPFIELGVEEQGLDHINRALTKAILDGIKDVQDEALAAGRGI